MKCTQVLGILCCHMHPIQHHPNLAQRSTVRAKNAILQLLLSKIAILTSAKILLQIYFISVALLHSQLGKLRKSDLAADSSSNIFVHPTRNTRGSGLNHTFCCTTTDMRGTGLV